MKKNILSYIVAGIFIFFIVYFGASIVIDHINDKNSNDEGSSPSIEDSSSIEVAEIKYTVVFNANDGSNNIKEQEYLVTEEKALLGNEFSRTGYTFEGWSTTTTGRVEYADGQVVKGLTEHAIKFNLYAVWKANSYTVKFDGNGAEGNMADLAMTYDTAKQLTANSFEKTGYTFTGWNTSKDGTGTSYSDKESVNNLLATGEITLYAQWSEHTYKVVFNANNGTTDNNEQVFGFEDEKALTTNTYSKEGYTFEGWSTTTTGRVEYTNGQVVNSLTSEDDAVINLYAVWVANTYTIKFDGNGAEGSMADQVRVYDDQEALSNNLFSKVGYTFAGWKLNDNTYENRYVGNLSSVNEDVITLVANWKEHTYKVVFNANNGTTDSNEQQFTYEEAKALSSNLYSKDGYNFVGWSTTPTGRKEFDNEQIISKLTSIDNGVMNLYAVWCANDYAIKFDGNSSSGSMNDMPMSYDVSKELPANVFEKEGYTFANWNTSKDGTGVSYEDKANVSNLVLNGEITLYAQWKEHTYKVVFNSNDETSQSIEQDFVYSVGQELLDNPFIKEGYTLLGWALSKDGNVVYENKENVLKLTNVDEDTINLYAVWSANTYTIKFDSNSGNGTMSDSIMTYDVTYSLPTNTFTKEGYTFVGWNDKANGEGTSYNDKQSVTNLLKEGSITLYAQWSINTYNFTYNYKDQQSGNKTYKYGETVIKTEEIIAIESESNFDKWIDGDGKDFTFNNPMKANDVIIYAIYKNESTVTYNYNGSNESITLVRGYVGDSIVQPAQNPTREGYDFIGWYTTAECDVLFNFYKTKMPEGGITIYAGWQAHTYVIKYDANGGTGSILNQNRIYDDNTSLTKNTITRLGYTFVCWVDEYENEYIDEYIGNLTSEDGKVITLKAKWKEHTYKINFYANNGTQETRSQNLTYTKQENLLKNTYSKLGYSFVGWATSANALEKEYDDEATIQSLTQQDNGEVNLYAVWVANSYVVEFNANGGVGSIENQNRSYDDGKALTLNSSISKEGYTFKGWLSSEGKTYLDGYVGNITSINNATVTLTAIWEENTYKVIFHANNGTIASNEQTFTYTQEQALNINGYLKLGFRFVGWSTTENGSKEYDDAQLVSKLSSTNNGEYHLYAIWAVNEYTIIYNANTTDYTGSMLNQEYAYTDNKALLEVGFIKDGYKLDGWALTSEGQVKYTDQQIVGQLSSINGDEITLYAIWSQISYKVELVANDNTTTSTINTYKYEDNVTLTNTFTRHGYTFVGWSTSKTGSKVYDNNAVVNHLSTTNNEVVSLYAVWSENEYTIIYNANTTDYAGSMLNQEFTYSESKALLPVEFVNVGYHLVGWSLTSDGEVVYEDQQIVSKLSAVDEDEITLYAIWQENTYNLEIHANHGTNSSEIYKLTYSQVFTLENNFNRVGFTFVGWSTTSDGEVIYESLDEVSMLTEVHEETYNLYAIWSEIDRRDVAFILDNKEVGTLKKDGSVYTYKHALLDANTSITIINYITDKMYEFECDVNAKAYYNVTVNLNTITITFEKTYDYIEVGEYDEVADSVEGIDEKDLSELKNVFDSITTSYTIETQTFFNPAAMDIINDIYDTNYQQHNIINATSSNDTDEIFTLFDVNSAYVDTYGATTVKYSSSYSVDYEGWTRVAENKYKCDRTEVVEHFRELLTPGLSNQGTYMTYKYVTVQINQDGSLTIRLYCSTTQSGKVIAEHKDKDNKPQWYMLLSEATITNIK